MCPLLLEEAKLSQYVQVHIVDGRTITGELACVDKQGTVVLQHAVQSLGVGTEERHMGMAIIPRPQRKDCLVEVRDCPCPAYADATGSASIGIRIYLRLQILPSEREAMQQLIVA